MSVKIEAPNTFRVVVHLGAPELEIFPYASETAFRPGVLVYNADGLWLTLAAVPATNADAPVDGTTWRLLGGRAVVAALFTPKDSDQWQHYQADNQHWTTNEDVTDYLGFYTGNPSQGTLLSYGAGVAVDSSGIVRVRESLRARPGASQFETGYEATRARSVGDIIYYHADSPYIGTKYLKCTVTAVGAVQRAGNARYRDLTVTTEQIGGNFYTGDAGYLRVTDDAPIGQVVPGSHVGVDNAFLRRLRDLSHWPVAMASGLAAFIQAEKVLDPLSSGYTSLRDEFRDLLNTVFARLDGSNLTVMFRSDVRGPWEPYTVTADQARKAYAAVDSDNEWGLNAVPVIGGVAVGITWRLDQANYAEVVAHWSIHRRVVFPNGVLLITGSVNELGNRTLQANVKLISGTLPAIDATARPTIRGVPTWDDVVTALRASGTADDDHLATEKAIRDAVAAGDDEAHDHIALLAELLDSFYEGWTSTDGANYSNANDIVNNLPVDLSSDDNATVPTANQPVILRPNNVTWTDGPAGIVWGFDFLSGVGRYVLGITAAGVDQILYKRDGNNWSKLWEDGAYEDGAADDPVFMEHWWDVADGDIKVADALETRRHQWSIPGISADLMGLYRRGTGDEDGKDVAAMFPNYGGGDIVDYSWNRFTLYTRPKVIEASSVTVGAAWADITADTYANDDWLAVQLYEEAGDRDSLYISPRKFSEYSTTYTSASSIAGVGITHEGNVTALPDENGNPDYKEFPNAYAASDFLICQMRETAVDDRAADWRGTFGDLPTSEDDAVQMRIDTGGARFQIWRDATSNKVRVNRAGAVNASNEGDLYKAGAYQQLQVRRNGTKLQYKLEGAISATSKLRVHKS